VPSVPPADFSLPTPMPNQPITLVYSPTGRDEAGCQYWVEAEHIARWASYLLIDLCDRRIVWRDSRGPKSKRLDEYSKTIRGKVGKRDTIFRSLTPRLALHQKSVMPMRIDPGSVLSVALDQRDISEKPEPREHHLHQLLATLGTLATKLAGHRPRFFNGGRTTSSPWDYQLESCFPYGGPALLYRTPPMSPRRVDENPG
jgi:hypothetical protein